VNESFARKYLSGEQVLGRTISVDMADENPFGESSGSPAMCGRDP